MASRNPPERDLATRLVLGLFAGITGASSMAVVRFAARRVGLIQRRMPEEAERWVARRVTGNRPRPSAGHVAAERLLHLGYGAAAGAAFAVATRSRSAVAGAAFGVATWLIGSGVLMPALGITRPLWRAGLTAGTVDGAAHLVYGVVTALGLTELATGAMGDGGRRLYAQHGRVG